MDRWETGMLAKSLAGHDKDKVYVIVGLDEQFTYLADGERKTLQSPKKKKKKHVQLIREQHEISEADDVKLKRILKEYKMSEKKESCASSTATWKITWKSLILPKISR